MSISFGEAKAVLPTCLANSFTCYIEITKSLKYPSPPFLLYFHVWPCISASTTAPTPQPSSRRDGTRANAWTRWRSLVAPPWWPQAPVAMPRRLQALTATSLGGCTGTSRWPRESSWRSRLPRSSHPRAPSPRGAHAVFAHIGAHVSETKPK